LDWPDKPIGFRIWNESSKRWTLAEKSPKGILDSLAEELSLAPADVQAILSRTVKLIQQKRHMGRSIFKLLLTEAYAYNKLPSAARPPLDVRKFVAVCASEGLPVQAREITRLVKGLDLSTGQDLSPTERIGRQRYQLSNKLGLTGSTIQRALNIAEVWENRPRFQGNSISSTSIAASALYLAAKSNRERVTQKQLSEHFGKTEVSIRTTTHTLQRMPEVIALLGQLEETRTPA
jgi:transcription initiation factor TFIIIB Brf1 subunit/transcription initiation factor TFIIB